MEIVVKILLIIHVVSGAVALLAALLAMSLRKGAQQHNFVGRIYFWAMMSVAATALPVSIARPNVMLFFVALFSAYMAYGGWRFAKRDRYQRDRSPYLEWGMLFVGIAMVAYGLSQVLGTDPMGWVLVAFGGIGIQFAVQDIRGWQKNEDFASRLINHLTHMLGGTIATVTAVLVQQVVPRLGEHNQFAVVVWLGPTVVLTPLIFVWANHVARTKSVRLFHGMKKQ